MDLDVTAFEVAAAEALETEIGGLQAAAALYGWATVAGLPYEDWVERLARDRLSRLHRRVLTDACGTGDGE